MIKQTERESNSIGDQEFQLSQIQKAPRYRATKEKHTHKLIPGHWHVCGRGLPDLASVGEYFLSTHEMLDCKKGEGWWGGKTTLSEARGRRNGMENYEEGWEDIMISLDISQCCTIYNILLRFNARGESGTQGILFDQEQGHPARLQRYHCSTTPYKSSCIVFLNTHLETSLELPPRCWWSYSWWSC